MMKKILLIPVFFWLAMLTAVAGEVTVSGHLSGFKPGSLVRVLAPADPFSQWEKTLAETHTDEKGNFRLQFSIDHPVYARLAVNLKKGELFLFPGGSYQVKVVHKKMNQQGSVFDQQPLQLDVNATDNGMTDQVGKFNAMYNAFVVQHFRSVYQYHNQRILSRFEDKVDSVFQGVGPGYLKNYIRYSLASLQWGARKWSPKAFVLKYFVKQPVLYRNVQYAQVFNNFFASYFSAQINGPVTPDQLQNAVSTGQLDKLDALFRKDSVFMNDARVRQLAEMVVLKRLYYQQVYLRSDIVMLLRQMERKSPFSENSKVAGNRIKKLTYLNQGTKAPEFTLPDFTGKEYGLKDWKGKFVLLAFYKTNCPVCIGQWSMLKDMRDKIGSDFQPVVVVDGSAVSNYQQLYEAQNRRIPFLLLGKEILLLEKYQVKTFPAYVLINPDGTIAMAPAPMLRDQAVQKISLYIDEYKKRK